MSWDITSPAGSDPAAQGDDEIRQFKSDLQDALQAQETEGVEAVFPGSDAGNPVYRPRFPKGATGARPAAGQYGLYINETTKTIDRDNGSAWEAVATLIPVGTVAIFFQATAPLGWTKLTTQDDKALRVVSGVGGGSGGSAALSTAIPMAHTHTYGVLAHVHKTAELRLSSTGTRGSSAAGAEYGLESIASASRSIATYVGTTSSSTDQSLLTDNPSAGSATGNTGSTGTDITLAYADVIICSKD